MRRGQQGFLDRSENLEQFAEFVTGAGRTRGLWKKFLNHKSGNSEKDGVYEWQSDGMQIV